MPSFDRDGALKRAERALRQGRIDAAIAEYVQLTEAEPLDLKTAHALGDLYVRAGQTERALAQYARTADQLSVQGLHAEALTLFHKSLKLRPGDDYATTRVREISRRIGLAAGGALPRSGPAEPAPAPAAERRLAWLAVAEAALRDGRFEDGRQVVAEALQADAGQADPVCKTAALGLAHRIAATAPDAGYQVIDVLVERSLGENDHTAATAALQEFVARVRHHLPALMRLVDVAMEGGLEPAMYEAQAQLADAYLDAGHGLEARIISEDLVAREPWNRANLERFRNAMALLGEPDPDAVIAERLSGESPFLATDLADFARQQDGDDGLEIFEPETIRAAAQTLPPPPLPPAVPEAPVLPMPPVTGRAAPVGHEERAAASYRLGLAHRDLGLLDDALRALELATASERLRCAAAACLGSIHRRRGQVGPAIAWLERAVRWAPPATDIGRALRYDLGDVLEAAGDHDRALAVFTGLESEQAGYHDAATRIQRLIHSGPRG